MSSSTLHRVPKPGRLGSPLILIAALCLTVATSVGCSDEETCSLGPGLCGKDGAVADLAVADLAVTDSGGDTTPAADLPGGDALLTDSAPPIPDGPAGDTSPAVDAVATPDVGSSPDAAYVHQDISVKDLQTRLLAGEKLTVVDVREPSELVAGGKIAGALNMPWISGGLKLDYGKLPTTLPIVVVCQSGGRSNAAADFLVTKGLMPVLDVLGGMSAWVSAGYPVVK
jgi:rhodanese-related sulfurtransferase